MKTHIFQNALCLALVSMSLMVVAEDELVVYVIKDGAVYDGATIVLDGDESIRIEGNGIVEFDLTSGGHSLQVLDGQEVIHAFRFDSANGQLVDVTAVLDSESAPKVSVENYFVNESAIDRANATEGGVSGQVYFGNSLAVDAEVEIAGVQGRTDSNGRFNIEAPRGVYDVVVTKNGSTELIEDVRVVSNVIKPVGVVRLKNLNQSELSNRISIDAPVIEEVTVTASFNPNAFGESEQYASGIVNTMGTEELARFGGSDVAASVGRIPSVTVQDSKYLFIRGLGGRYITTTLNGSAMPSTDPNRRTVPLDLFPTNMVEQLDVKKTFLAEMPGETTGGNLEINTRAFPNDAESKIRISIGGNTDITGETVAVDPYSGKFDEFGFDDGSRSEPGVVSAISTFFNEAPVGTISDQIETNLNQIATSELIDNIDLKTKKANTDLSIGYSFGDSTYINDYEIGVFSAINYSNKWSSRTDGVQRSFSGGNVSDDFSVDRSSNNIELSGLVSLGLNVGNHSYEAVTLMSRVTESEVTTADGFDGDALQNTSNYIIYWEERQFISQQLSGEHVLDSLIAEWQITGSQAWRYAPDRREVRFDEETEGQPYVLSYADVLRNWEELTDTNLDATVDFEQEFDLDVDLVSSLKFGASGISRERLSESASYGFIANASVVDDSAPNRLFSDVINDSTVTGSRDTGFAFVDETLPSDEYDAELDLFAGYLSWENNFASEYEFILGVRYEDFSQLTNTFSLTGTQAAVPALIDETDVLPSFAFNWYYSPTQQLRFAVSETVSRPDFKETANAVFYDDEFSDVRVRGNSDLVVSHIQNYDLRWEMYGDHNDKLSVALFYKDIDDAIERVALTASGTAGNSRTFRNADSAYISGVELDFRKDIDLNSSLTKSMFVAGNVSYIDSESIVENEPVRALQGQPEYTFNTIIGWDDLDSDQQLTLIFSQNGQSIRDVGVNDQADIVEEPRLDVTLSYSKKFQNGVGFKAKVHNLLDEDVEFTQAGQVFRSYGEGVSFNLGLDYDFSF